MLENYTLSIFDCIASALSGATSVTRLYIKKKILSMKYSAVQCKRCVSPVIYMMVDITVYFLFMLFNYLFYTSV